MRNCHKTFSGDEAVYLGTDLSLRCYSAARDEVVQCQNDFTHICGRRRSYRRPSLLKEQEKCRSDTKREMAELTFQIIGRVLERMPRVRPCDVIVRVSDRLSC